MDHKALHKPHKTSGSMEVGVAFAACAEVKDMSAGKVCMSVDHRRLLHSKRARRPDPEASRSLEMLVCGLRVVRPGGGSEVKRPSGREWGSVLIGLT